MTQDEFLKLMSERQSERGLEPGASERIDGGLAADWPRTR